MEKILVWYQLSFKAQFRKTTTWVQLLAMFLLVLLLSSMYLPDGQNMTAGVYTADSEIAERIYQKLTKDQTVFTFIKYDSEAELQTDVQAGKVECGFFVAEDFDEQFERGKFRGAVRQICAPSASKDGTMGETFYTGFFRVYCEYTHEQSEEQFFDNHNEERMEEWQERNLAYIYGEDAFKIDYQHVEGSSYKDINSEKFPIQGIAGFMILLILFLYYGRKFEADKDKVVKALMPKERMVYTACGMLANATLPAVMGLILVMLCPDSRGIWQETCAMAVFLIYAIVWVMLLGGLSRSMENHISLILIMLVLNLVICPILIDLSVFFPAMRYLKYLSPVGLYLGVFV